MISKLYRPLLFAYKSNVFLFKLTFKVLLGNNPLIYKTLKALRISQHGSMHSSSYVIDLYHYFSAALSQIDPSFLSRDAGVHSHHKFVEIGPGDNLGLSFLFRLLHGYDTYAVDHKPFAHSVNLSFLSSLASYFHCTTPTDSLVSLYHQTTYLTDSYHSLSKMPPSTVSLVVSNAAFEHIRLADVPRYFDSIYRCLLPNAICLLQIDLKDHLTGDFLHSLVPTCLWESPFTSNGLHYTNRLGISDYISSARVSGFTVLSALPNKMVPRSFVDPSGMITSHSLFTGISRPSSFLLLLRK